jgi:hypothetical protein
MTNSQNERRPVPRNSGFFQDIATRAKLVGRLVMDGRVSPFLKVLPVGTLLYVVFPDLLPLNPVDDAFVLWLGTYLFVELCPPELVAEHIKTLTSVIPGQTKDPTKPAAEEDIVDGEFYERKP